MNIRYPGVAVPEERRAQDEYSSLYGLPLPAGKVVKGVPQVTGEHLCAIGMTEQVSDEEVQRLEEEAARRIEEARLAEIEAAAAAARAVAPPAPPAPEPPAESQETERPERVAPAARKR